MIRKFRRILFKILYRDLWEHIKKEKERSKKFRDEFLISEGEKGKDYNYHAGLYGAYWDIYSFLDH